MKLLSSDARKQDGRGNLVGPSNPLHWRHGYEPVLHRADVWAELGVEEDVSIGLVVFVVSEIIRPNYFCVLSIRSTDRLICLK